MAQPPPPFPTRPPGVPASSDVTQLQAAPQMSGAHAPVSGPHPPVSGAQAPVTGAQPPVSGAQPAVTGAPCPGCGVHVPFGYVSCPRCRTRMPPGHAGGRMRPSRSGGTAVTSDEPGPAWPWLVAVGGFVGAALLLWLLVGGNRGAGTADAGAGAGNDAAGPSDARPRPDARRKRGPSSADRAEALEDLEASIKELRLWAIATPDPVDPNLVIIQSGECSDPRMATTADAAVPRLQALGFSGLECDEPGGRRVFERSW